MLFEGPGRPLARRVVETPRPAPGQVLLRVKACGICRTDLHIRDGELAVPRLPLIPGHQIVGVVVAAGPEVSTPALGERVGVPWLGATCGRCPFCASGRENLCDQAAFTGYQLDGGYAELAVADARFCFKIPGSYSDLQAAPLLCGGLIGFRALRMTGPARRLGFYGFGSAAHILVQLARFEGREVFALTRPGDREAQAFARQLGAVWAGDPSQGPPAVLDAAIIFAPAGELVPQALQAVGKGGTVVLAGIHMSDLPSLPYKILWGERVLRSVANLTRADGREFLELAPRVPVQTEVTVFPLEDAEEALAALRSGRIRGSGVLAVENAKGPSPLRTEPTV